MNPPIDLSNTVLTTSRLTLRPWEAGDLNDFYAYASVDGVGQMAGWQPHESKAVSQEILNRFIEGKKTFALVYAGKAIGSLGVEKYDEERFPEFSALRGRELGFVLSKDYWGRGLMPEAVEAVVQYLFTQIGLDFLLCGHFLRNTQSARVQEKCGFRHYAFGQFRTRMGTLEPDEQNLLTRQDWLNRTQRRKP